MIDQYKVITYGSIPNDYIPNVATLVFIKDVYVETVSKASDIVKRMNNLIEYGDGDHVSIAFFNKLLGLPFSENDKSYGWSKGDIFIVVNGPDSNYEIIIPAAHYFGEEKLTFPFTVEPGRTYEFSGTIEMPDWVKANPSLLGKSPMVSILEEFEKIQKGPVKNLAKEWDKIANKGKLYKSDVWKELGEKLGNMFKPENLKGFKEEEKVCDCVFCRQSKEEPMKQTEPKKYSPLTMDIAHDIKDSFLKKLKEDYGLSFPVFELNEEIMDKIAAYVEDDEKAVDDSFKEFLAQMGIPHTLFTTMPKNIGRTQAKEFMNGFYGSGLFTPNEVKDTIADLGTIHCDHCDYDFIPIDDFHRIVIEESGDLFFPMNNSTLYDSWDCPMCGGQVLGKERLADADDDCE